MNVEWIGKITVIQISGSRFPAMFRSFHLRCLPRNNLDIPKYESRLNVSNKIIPMFFFNECPYVSIIFVLSTGYYQPSVPLLLKSCVKYFAKTLSLNIIVNIQTKSKWHQKWLAYSSPDKRWKVSDRYFRSGIYQFYLLGGCYIQPTNSSSPFKNGGYFPWIPKSSLKIDIRPPSE